MEDVALDMDELDLGMEFEEEDGLDSDRDDDDEVKPKFFEKKLYTLFYSEFNYKTITRRKHILNFRCFFQH
jgi:hypothetical protein